MRAALMAVFVMLGSPTLALAQASSERAPVVLVIDSGPLRLNSDRLARAVSRALTRDVVRLTDPRAGAAIERLTIAYDADRLWHVRVEAHGHSVTLIERAVPPGAVDSRLADSCRRAMAELEAAHEAPATAPVTPLPEPDPRAYAQAGYFLWTQEILDPFVEAPRPMRREIAIFSEVIDPFAPIAARRSVFSEVLDPWEPLSQ